MKFFEHFDSSKMLVSIYDTKHKADIAKTLVRLKLAKLVETDESIDMSEALQSLDLTSTVPITTRRHSSARASITRFNDYRLPEKTLMKMTLLSIPEPKQVVFVRNDMKIKRIQFLASLNKWYDERRKKLNKLEYIKIGMPCCVYVFELINKYSRGLISFINADYCRVYLVDYCTVVNVQLPQIYEIDEQFLQDFCYAHKCQIDSKTNDTIIKEIEGMRTYIKNLLLLNSPMSVSQNINTILNRYEYSIEITEVNKTPMNVEISNFNDVNFNSYSYLYKAKILDKKIMHDTNDEAATKNIIDETTENILCSTYRDMSYKNDLNDLTNILNTCNSASSLPRRFQAFLNATDISCSTITETTMLSNLSSDNDEIIAERTNYEISKASKQLKYRKKHSKVQSKNQTSRWINDDEREKNLDQSDDESNAEKFESIKLNFIKSMDRKRVRIVPHTFHPSEFFCQLLDFIDEYEKMQEKMNIYYENQELNIDKNLLKYLNIGDYCAAKFSKNWSRCRIMDLMNNLALLECIDDGRTLRLHVDKLKLLNNEFKYLHALAFKCKLYGMDTTKLLTFDQIAFDKFKSLIFQENKEFIAEIVVLNEDNGHFFYEINLFNNYNINILEILKNN